MKKHWALCLAIIFAVPAATHATAYDDRNSHRQLGAPQVLADLFLLRPAGLVMTVVGTGLFFATSPFMAISSIAPPHDAVNRTANALVVAPAAFTFMRPVGDFTYQGSGSYPPRP